MKNHKEEMKRLESLHSSLESAYMVFAGLVVVGLELLAVFNNH